MRIIEIEGPIHKDVLFKRVTELASVNRVGSRIALVLNDVLSDLSQGGFIKRKADFLWLGRNDLSLVRNREHLPPLHKKIQYIHPKEIESAIKQAIQGTFGISIESIPPIAARLLGFSNTSNEIRKTVIATARRLIKKNILTDRDVIVGRK